MADMKKIHKIAVTGILAAAAYILMLLEIPVPMLMPTFIKFDFSDLPALLGAFALGPMTGILVELIKNIFHIANTGSFGVGELSNFLMGAVFSGMAGLWYKYHRTKAGAITGSFLGASVMAIASVPINYFVVYPVYYNFLPEETILAAYQAIIPGMKSILMSLICFNLPFTFVKGMIDVGITFLIYKHLSPILKGVHEVGG
ncbi:ECF transporter S component [Clostridium vitabionis]|uniref:ECF transporter S component n=1 Tax=Clostridium vitabionis TaxID=2784388 RepID=UPI00188B1B44